MKKSVNLRMMKKNVKVLVIKVNGDGWISRRYIAGEEVDLKSWMYKYLVRVGEKKIIGCNIDSGYCDVMIGNKRVEIDIVSCKVL